VATVREAVARRDRIETANLTMVLICDDGWAKLV
jgi:hypothetical protein